MNLFILLYTISLDRLFLWIPLFHESNMKYFVYIMPTFIMSTISSPTQNEVDFHETKDDRYESFLNKIVSIKLEDCELLALVARGFLPLLFLILIARKNDENKSLIPWFLGCGGGAGSNLICCGRNPEFCCWALCVIAPNIADIKRTKKLLKNISTKFLIATIVKPAKTINKHTDTFTKTTKNILY